MLVAQTWSLELGAQIPLMLEMYVACLSPKFRCFV